MGIICKVNFEIRKVNITKKKEGKGQEENPGTLPLVGCGKDGDSQSEEPGRVVGGAEGPRPQRGGRGTRVWVLPGTCGLSGKSFELS